MKNMKKFAAGFIALTLGVSLLTACSVKQEYAPSSTEERYETAGEASVSEMEPTMIAGAEEKTTEAPTTEAPTTTAPTTPPPTPEEPTVSPNIGLTALAIVPNYVNVRKGPATSFDVVGKIFNNCAATILDEVEGEDGNWFLMTSGNVTGYIKSTFFLVGAEAEAMREQVGVLQGIVKEDYLRVRSEPDLSTLDNVFTFYEKGTVVLIEELTEDGWAKIKSDDASSGFVYAECLDISRVFDTAITLEEEAEIIRKREEAEEAARKAQEEYERKLREEEAARIERERQLQLWAQQEAERIANQAQQQQVIRDSLPILPADSEATAALRNAVVAFALQFVGNPYVHGGRSLVTGTDCSGFTSLVYQNFGYMLSYTPAGQSEQGIQVSVEDLRPGDLLFYSNSTKYLGHVAMYIGNGQIVHAGTVETGIEVRSAFYRDPLFARRIIQ